MSLELSALHGDAARFESTHWVHLPAGNGTHLVTLTGLVEVNLGGLAYGEWKEERLTLELPFPTSFFPEDRWFQVEQWAPFLTISAIDNQREGIHAGWAVAKYGGPGAVRIRDGVKIWADIAVRNSDAYLLKVGYTLTVCGSFVEAPSAPG